MYSYLFLDNYKSLKDVYIDFMKNNKEAKNLIVIYGENGSGKTNIIDSFTILHESIISLYKYNSIFNYVQEIAEENEVQNNNQLNKRKKIIADLLKTKYKNPILEFKDYYMIGSEEDMTLEYGILIDGVEGYYRLVFDREGLKEETLYHLLDKRRGQYYSIKREDSSIEYNYSNKIFKKNTYTEKLFMNVEKYWGKHTFLAIIFQEMAIVNNDFFDSNVDVKLKRIIYRALVNSNAIYESKDIEFYNKDLIFSNKFNILENINQGEIKEEDHSKLVITQDVLSRYLKGMYSDIQGVSYKVNHTDNASIEYELYVQKIINSKLISIPIKWESKGTQKIINWFTPIISLFAEDNIAIIDEADNGIHDLLFCTLINNIKNNINGQLIITTHNTSLLETLDKGDIYLIDTDAYGQKEVVCLDEYSVQKNNNIRNKYLSGSYGAIPSINSIDIERLYLKATSRDK